MAGVGFELKKMFKRKGGFFSVLKGYAVSAMVTEGPMLLCIVMLFGIRLLLKQFGASYAEQEDYLITTTYIMTFSLIFSNTVLMFVSRFVSNCIYENKLKDIMPSFYAIVFWILLISGILSGIYMIFMEKTFFHKLFNWLQFMIMLIVWIQMAYLSAIKKYMRVLLGFIVAAIVAIGTAAVFMILGVDPLSTAFLSSVLGYSVMAIMYMQEMIQYFPEGKVNLFIFFPALDKYKDLLLTGWLTSLGLFGHTMVFWFSQYGVTVRRGMVYCMKYDIAGYYASLTIIPFLVTFVVSLEVNFYQNYKQYFDTIMCDGTYDDIMFENYNLKKTLFREIAHVFEIQFFLELICVIFGGNYLATIGFDREMVLIFRYLCLGYMFYALAKSTMILLMYFDARIEALKISAVFAGLGILFSVVTLYLGPDTFGLGFALAAVISSVYGLCLLNRYVKRLEFHVFCSQPLFANVTEGTFETLGGKLNEKLSKKRKKKK
ncbi:MAG: hypothetical protein E7260_00085 [Lachnospiraceae bacterium]|nr:hypothetical protein [Lachnospiraceae bacterium]